MKTILRIFYILILLIVLLLAGVFIAIQTPSVQSYITERVLTSLNEQFGTSIEVGGVDIDFWGDINLYEVKAKDHRDLEFIKIPKLTADISLWRIYRNSSDIRVKKLDLENAHIQVKTYEGDSISNFIRFIDKFIIEDSEDDSEFKIRGDIKIIDSKLSIINYNLDPKKQVWLDSENFNTVISDVNVTGSTYSANIEQFSMDAKKNGEDFQVENLSSIFRMDDRGIYLDNLDFKTQSSQLDGYIHLKYDSIEEFDDFGNKVFWEIQLEDESKLGYKDLRYFMPDWTKDEVIELSGNLRGPLNNLNAQNLTISNGITKIKTTNISVGELMNGSYAINTNYIEANTSYADLKRILPDDLAKSLTDFLGRFGVVNYKGALQIDEKDLYANGNLTSALGNAKLKLNMYDYAGNQPSYNGNVNTAGFDLKKLTDTEELGKVAGDLRFDGKGFDLESLRINAKGKLNYLDIAGDRYQNISVNGILNHEKFDGILAINDPNAKLNYDGIFDFSTKHLKVDFKSDVDYFNLTRFGVTDTKNTWLKGKIDGIASFSELNDLNCDLHINDLVFNTDTLQLNVPLADFHISTLEGNQRNVIVDVPGYVYADLNGEFLLDELPNVFQNGIGQFLVNYDEKKTTPNQSFEFNINVQDNIVSYFVPDLYVQPDTNITGRADNDAELFEIHMISPFLQYADYKADSVNLFVTTLDDRAFNLDAKSLLIQNYLIQDFKVNGHRQNDTIIANAHFWGGEQREGEFNLNFYQTFSEGTELKTGFSPSTISVDNKVWHINPENDKESNYAILDFDKNRFLINEILFQSDEQFLRINGDYISRDDFKVDVDLENVLLSKVIPPSLLGDFSIEGIANGNVDIIKTKNELKPVADLKIDSISMNGYQIGNFVTNASYDIEQQIFNIEGSLDKDNVNTLYLTGEIDNKGDAPQLDLIADLDDFNINILSVFLDEVLSDWKGTLSGDVSLKGNATDPSLSGFITANDIGFKVVYLGTTYNMVGENDFILQKEPGTSGYLTLPDVEFVEKNSKTKGMVDGLLIFSDLSNWFMDLDFEADRLLVMNTTVADNELFYGRVYAGGNFSMYGPASDMELSGYDVDVLKGSTINLNTGATATVDSNRFIQFYSYDEQGNMVEPEEANQEISGFSIDLDANVDEGTTVNLVLDAQSDDKIQARGNASNFKLQMNRAGNLNIDGEYVISDGIYSYREALVIDKDFELEKGGYIRFDGDPFNATMDLRAKYSRYVNNIGEYLGLSTTQATIVDLVIAISGNLENTNIEFLVEAPDASSQIKSALQNKLSNNTDERMKQASFLLVLGRFGTEELLAAGNATGAATASAFELLGKQVGNLFSSIIPGFELNPTYLQASNRNSQSDRIQTQYNWALNERFKINGAVGTPLGTEYNEPVTMQVELDYDISKKADGGLVLRAFSRPSTLGIENFNVNSTFAQSYGAGVVYRRSFNSFRELLNRNREDEKSEVEKSKFRKSDKPEEEVPAQDSLKVDFPKDSVRTEKEMSFIRFGN